MAYNFSREYAKFEKEQAKIREILKKEGTDEGKINEILDVYKSGFLSDMRFYRRLADMDIETLDEMGMLAGEVPFYERLTYSYSRFWWLDEIEDEKLLLALKSCSEKELSIIDDIAFSGFTQAETAKRQGMSQGNISKNLNRIRGKIDTSSFRS